MTLDDFFTSTELEDGLTTPARVNELITVLQTEKENIVINVNDSTTRQWSAVAKLATAIAATKNQECLDLFVQLDGLGFIDKWLKDSQNGGFDDVIIALLTGLERLCVDHERLVGSGIVLTVQGYIGHSSLTIREKAKELCDMWARLAPKDVDSVDNNNNIENVEQTVLSDSVKEETHKAEMNMESETEIVTGVANELKSDDVKEQPEVDCLTALTSNTDVDHHVESTTKTETMEDVDKDEEMAEIDTASGSGGGGGGLRELVDGDDIKPASGSESDGDDEDEDEDEKKDVESGSEDDSGNRERVLKRSMKSQDEDLISKRPSDMELDYGMVDPLELARQVANEVELEVDSQEQSCSSTTSEKEQLSSGPGEPGKEVSSGPGPGPALEPDIIASQVNETGQSNPEKGFSGFDLNQEFSSDETETDRPVDQILTTPISVVSASRATAADGPPVAPLQFEGALGWKGSAATSAFRRIPEGEKVCSYPYSPSSSQRLTQLDFDLNVTEGVDNKIQDFLSKAESSSRPELDLNSLSDGDAAITSLDWKLDSRATSTRPNGAHSQSYNSIDLNLNNQLTSQRTASFNNPFLAKPFNNKPDESVFSLFGTQFEVNRNEYMPPSHPRQPTNGRILEPSVDFSLGRPGSMPEPGLGFGLGSSVPYTNLPAYGYGHNGYTMGPMYAPPSAPIPYMVDSRGAPIIPQIPPAYSQPAQPFFFNMGANGAGPSRNSLDLNPGFVTEMGNRENNNMNNNVGLRQFLNHNHNQASSSSGIGGKREEPDSGWELFPMNYKHQHQQPPWQ